MRVRVGPNPSCTLRPTSVRHSGTTWNIVLIILILIFHKLIKYWSVAGRTWSSSSIKHPFFSRLLNIYIQNTNRHLVFFSFSKHHLLNISLIFFLGAKSDMGIDWNSKRRWDCKWVSMILMNYGEISFGSSFFFPKTKEFLRKPDFFLFVYVCMVILFSWWVLENSDLCCHFSSEI